MKTISFYFLGVLILVAACATGNKEVLDGYSYLQKEIQIKPSYSEDYSLKYHFYAKNDTTVFCFFELDPTQFLAKRDSSDQLNRNFSLHFIAKKNKVTSEILFQKSFSWSTNDTLPILDSIPFKLPYKKDCWTELVISDDNKHLFSAIQTWWLRENENLNSQFILINPQSHQPIIDQYGYSDSLFIQSDLFANSTLQLALFSNLNKPANAPFASSNSEPDFMRPDATFTSKFRGKFFQIPLKNQFVKISSTVTNQSMGYFNFSEPTIQCEALCMQYICTNDEIEELKKASNKFDYYTQFWLKAAKQDLQLATQLHAEFRRRIVIANQKFSSYKMGSLTDRGMIYIVFGDYIAAEKTDFSEKWIYANTGDALNEFLFRQSKNEFISNHFVLERDLASKSVYYFAVEKWRNGLIELKD